MPEQQHSLTCPYSNFHLSTPRLPSHFWTHRMFRIRVFVRRSVGVGHFSTHRAPRRRSVTSMCRLQTGQRPQRPQHFGACAPQVPVGQSAFCMEKVHRRVTGGPMVITDASIRTFSTDGECVCCMCVVHVLLWSKKKSTTSTSCFQNYCHIHFILFGMLFPVYPQVTFIFQSTQIVVWCSWCVAASCWITVLFCVLRLCYCVLYFPMSLSSF